MTITFAPPCWRTMFLFLVFYYYARLTTCFVLSMQSIMGAQQQGRRSYLSAVEAESVTSLINPSIAAPSPRGFHWWNSNCDRYLDELDQDGGERFVAFHDGNTANNNWLHVTSSTPERRAQYELRYVNETLQLAGVVRFGVDCEGPQGHVHGGAMATVADAITATAVFKASERWGLTTRLDCNYREMLPVETPIKVVAIVTELKKRKAIVEWKCFSLTKVDRRGEPVQHSFGTAEFLLPRKE